MKRKNILIASFTVSLLFHAVALIFLQRYSLWFSSTVKPDPNSDWLSFVDKKERDQILKTAFEPTQDEVEPIEILPQKEETAPLACHLNFDATESEHPDFTYFENPFLFSIQEPLISKSNLPVFSIPAHSSLNLLDHLPKELIVSAPKKKQTQKLFPFFSEPKITFLTKPPILDIKTDIKPDNHLVFINPNFKETVQPTKIQAEILPPKLPKIPTLAELETASYSDSFDADLVFLSKDGGSGYIFALTLIPRFDLNLPRFRQHLTFLIDRSNSIQQHRLNSTKSAMHKALSYLYPKDTFNIITFDSKLQKMSPNNLTCNRRSFAIAEEFLQNIQLGSFFSSSDILQPLFLTVPKSVQNDEIYTTILLTDGESLSKKQTTQNLLHDWTQFNAGKVSLFAVGMRDANVEKLETAAIFNKGKLSIANSNRGIKRKLLKLLKTIQNPIAKNLVCSAISHSPQSKIQIFPKSTQMPHLYLNQPYVILGETDSLDDFILFVQGRLKNRWLNIRKTISFLNARKGNKTLRKEFTFQKVYHLYEKFLIDQNPVHLVEAEALLTPFDCQVAIQ